MVWHKRIRQSRDGRGHHGLGLWWTFSAGLVGGAAVIVAIVQNSRSVRLHYLAWHIDVSLIVVVLTTALVALTLDEVGGLIWRRRRRSLLARRSELDGLRASRDAEEPPADVPPASPEAEPIRAGGADETPE
jgi:uncharacterized integral membrane protein